MNMQFDVPDYDENTGLKRVWENGFEVEVSNKNDEIVIIANKAGLISLAIQLLTLAQDGIPSGYHLHYDEVNSLEEGSSQMIVQKK
jgi:hypothetical protein